MSLFFPPYVIHRFGAKAIRSVKAATDVSWQAATFDLITDQRGLVGNVDDAPLSWFIWRKSTIYDPDFGRQAWYTWGQMSDWRGCGPDKAGQKISLWVEKFDVSGTRGHISAEIPHHCNSRAEPIACLFAVPSSKIESCEWKRKAWKLAKSFAVKFTPSFGPDRVERDSWVAHQRARLFGHVPSLG